jgi:hypothetical protein
MQRMMAGMLLTLAAAQTEAQVRMVTAPVPTLDEFGLVGLSLIVAIAGAFAARRRKS